MEENGMPTILHLDRSRFYRNIIKRVVLKKKFSCVDSQDSRGAFELLKKRKIDLISTSKELEDCSAKDFLKKLSQSEFDKIPVIVLTSADSARIREEFFSLGISNYFLKNETAAEHLDHYLDQFLEEDFLEEEFTDISCAILGDNRKSINEITSTLRSWGITEAASFESSAVLLQQEKGWDVYFIEAPKSQIAGKRVVQELKRRNAHCVIIITSENKNNKAISHLLNSGANDYMPKPFTAGFSFARFKAHIRTLRMLQRQEQRNTELERLASIDGLTEAYNRRHILLCLKGELEKAARYHRNLSILLLDIDHFKDVNDNYGHPAGDIVLRQFVQTVKAQCRDVDIFGRYGGEEFLLLMPETAEKNARILAERIRSTVADHVFLCVPDKITVSGGLMEFGEEKSNELIKEVDRRLYLAKHRGRNQIVGSEGNKKNQKTGDSA